MIRQVVEETHHSGILKIVFGRLRKYEKLSQ
jgi:hypothetical protein